MATGPGADCGSAACDAAVATPVTEEDRPEKPAELSPTSTAPKKISFSISSILDDGAKPVPDLQQADDVRSAASTAVAGPSRTDKSESAQLTFFYREKLLSLQKTQPSSEGGCSADALISSWTVPPTSPFVYREYNYNIPVFRIIILFSRSGSIQDLRNGGPKFQIRCEAISAVYVAEIETPKASKGMDKNGMGGVSPPQPSWGSVVSSTDGAWEEPWPKTGFGIQGGPKKRTVLR